MDKLIIAADCYYIDSKGRVRGPLKVNDGMSFFEQASLDHWDLEGEPWPSNHSPSRLVEEVFVVRYKKTGLPVIGVPNDRIGYMFELLMDYQSDQFECADDESLYVITGSNFVRLVERLNAFDPVNRPQEFIEFVKRNGSEAVQMIADSVRQIDDELEKVKALESKGAFKKASNGIRDFVAAMRKLNDSVRDMGAHAQAKVKHIREQMERSDNVDDIDEEYIDFRKAAASGLKIPYVKPVDEIKFLEVPSTLPASEFEKALLANIAKSFGLSYEQMTRDYRRMTYGCPRYSWVNGRAMRKEVSDKEALNQLFGASAGEDHMHKFMSHHIASPAVDIVSSNYYWSQGYDCAYFIARMTATTVCFRLPKDICDKLRAKKHTLPQAYVVKFNERGVDRNGQVPKDVLKIVKQYYSAVVFDGPLHLPTPDEINGMQNYRTTDSPYSDGLMKLRDKNGPAKDPRKEDYRKRLVLDRLGVRNAKEIGANMIDAMLLNYGADHFSKVYWDELEQSFNDGVTYAPMGRDFARTWMPLKRMFKTDRLDVYPRPKVGSLYRHHNGNLYIVTGFNNEEHGRQEEYPTRVEYKNFMTDKKYSRALVDWWRSMREVHYSGLTKAEQRKYDERTRYLGHKPEFETTLRPDNWMTANIQLHSDPANKRVVGVLASTQGGIPAGTVMIQNDDGKVEPLKPKPIVLKNVRLSFPNAFEKQPEPTNPHDRYSKPDLKFSAKLTLDTRDAASKNFMQSVQKEAQAHALSSREELLATMAAEEMADRILKGLLVTGFDNDADIQKVLDGQVELVKNSLKRILLTGDWKKANHAPDN